MTIKTALALSDSLASSATLTPEQWAIRVLAGAYRRQTLLAVSATSKQSNCDNALGAARKAFNK